MIVNITRGKSQKRCWLFGVIHIIKAIWHCMELKIQHTFEKQQPICRNPTENNKNLCPSSKPATLKNRLTQHTGWSTISPSLAKANIKAQFHNPISHLLWQDKHCVQAKKKSVQSQVHLILIQPPYPISNSKHHKYDPHKQVKPQFAK